MSSMLPVLPADWRESLPTPLTEAEGGDGWSGDAVCVPFDVSAGIEREREALRIVMAGLCAELRAMQVDVAGLERAESLLREIDQDRCRRRGVW